MGKGADDCGGASMSSMLGEDAQGADLRRILLSERQEDNRTEAQKANITNMSAAIKRAKAVEERERIFHTNTLDQLQTLHTGGASKEELDNFFIQRQEELKTLRSDEFDLFIEQQASREPQEYPADDDKPLTTRQLEGRRAASHILLFDSGLDSLPEEVRFQAEFFASKDFVANWQNELSDAGLNPETGYATATGKSAEDCWRDATRRTLGLSREQIAAGDTLASWTSPNGSLYDIEMMSEFSKTALFDLILRVRREGSNETNIITNQQKSTARFTKPKADDFNPDPKIAKPKHVKIKLAQVSGSSQGEDEPYRRYSLAETAREFQIRMLATSTLTETSPLVQQDDAKQPWFAHHSSRVSLPQVHKAIAANPDLQSLFRPVETSTDFKDPETSSLRRRTTWRLEAEVAVPGITDPVVLQSSIFLSSKRRKSNGSWSVDKDLTGARDGSIMISIPNQGWVDLHRIDTAGIGLMRG